MPFLKVRQMSGGLYIETKRKLVGDWMRLGHAGILYEKLPSKRFSVQKVAYTFCSSKSSGRIPMFIEPKTVVWIAGASRRLGRAIEHKLDHSRYTIIPTDIEVDITDLTTVVQHADTYRPEIIINCAAMARKEDAEANPDLAYKVNALGARNLAIAATGSDATLVHLSTDDLFPGVIAHPINEFDKTLPPHIYGKSKEAGERLFANCVLAIIIVRSSWVYTANEDDLIARLLKACREGQTVEVPTNQYASPTSVDTLAEFIVAAL